MTSALGAGYTAAGVAVGPEAVRDAVGQALDGLRRPASFVLVFPPATLAPEAAVEQAACAAADVPWAGMSSDGVIASSAMVADGCAALAFDDTSTSASGSARAPHMIRAAPPGEPPPRRSPASTPEAGQPLLLLLYDANAGLHGELVAGAYEVVGPRVPLAGGGANAPVGRGPRIEPAQFAAGRACPGQRRRHRARDAGAGRDRDRARLRARSAARDRHAQRRAEDPRAQRAARRGRVPGGDRAVPATS